MSKYCIVEYSHIVFIFEITHIRKEVYKYTVLQILKGHRGYIGKRYNTKDFNYCFACGDVTYFNTREEVNEYIALFSFECQCEFI